MTKPKIYWLVSYPKSGNTWCRVFLANYISRENTPVDINYLDNIPVASSRFFIDQLLGLNSSELTPEEIAEYRLEAFRIYNDAAKDIAVIKVHDSFPEYDEPNFFTDDITAGVIYIVRNPLDVAVSLAFHLDESFDSSIDHINDNNYSFCNSPDKFEIQFPQRLSSWSGHVKSWMDNYNGKFHLVRYEDLLNNPYQEFQRLINFLGLPYNQDRLKRCIELSTFDSLKESETSSGFKEKSPRTKDFFREGRSGVWKKYLQQQQAARIIDSQKQIMRRLNYLDNNNDF